MAISGHSCNAAREALQGLTLPQDQMKTLLEKVGLGMEGRFEAGIQAAKAEMAKRLSGLALDIQALSMPVEVPAELKTI